MRSATFFLDGAFRRGSAFSKLVLIFAASGGALVAYADARTDPATEPSQAAPKKKVVVLGTGWAGTTFVRNVDSSLYDVQVISPRNYFAFTPLLPSVTCGTVEPRSIVEPIRKIIRKKGGEIKFWEAECFNIDPDNKKVHCRTNTGTNLERNGEFLVDYDYLVIAVGARVNTFNTPGVVQHCHFLKEVEDAQKIRKSVIDSFERAILPDLDEEERKRTLHFVIVGGGPTGVEFAAELHDFISEDLAKLYPTVCNLVKISVIEHGGHILTMFDKRISKFAEEKFRRDGIELRTGYRVVKVSDNTITMEDKLHVESSVSYGMAVWSAGVGARPIILDFMKQIAQGNRRALATDEWLRVRECDGVYAIGDCATMSQRKVMEDILEIFKFADKDNSGTLTVKEINDALEDICIRYPQVELYLKSNQMSNIVDLIKASKGDVRKESVELDIEEFKNALADVDSEVKNLPATAQVAAQQGNYLASCFNRMKHCDKKPEGPLRIRELGTKKSKTPEHILWSAIGTNSAESHLSNTWLAISEQPRQPLLQRSFSLLRALYNSCLPSTSQDPHKPSSITIILDWTRSSQEEREREKESERMGSRSKASLVVAASLAAVEALKDQAGLCRWNYMLRSLHQRAKNSSGGNGQFPQAKLTIPSVEPWRRGGVGAVERAKRTEQSMGKVMYLECWGPK
ncbi:Pyridine nucleotide-disulfide oxidoreductase [Musa troglodytarum]|uniref:NADH:ubiquinone reductase (non-electrogenic) n=1 Tax=Musa troglodytarum TaxID=320322 RepID=A0A9E7FA18_9LILI|nr:Pyridine nucleotide-disulfide oxidoreductase [Musa troglodytarum]